MGAVGERLRRERLKCGLDLDRISQETKIPARFLQAIEQEEFEKLPGRIFLFSFVRQYAYTLGLDGAQVMAQLRTEQEPPAPVSPPPRPVPPSVRVILAGATVAFLAIGLAYTALSRGSAPRVPATPQRRSSASSSSADRLAPSSPEEPAPRPAVVPAALRLVLFARQRTWVSARQDGRTAFSGTLQPNESRVLDGGATVDLVIGNPEAVEVSLNGRPVGIAGPRGELTEVRIAAPGLPPVVSHRKPLADIY